MQYFSYFHLLQKIPAPAVIARGWYFYSVSFISFCLFTMMLQLPLQNPLYFPHPLQAQIPV